MFLKLLSVPELNLHSSWNTGWIKIKKYEWF